MTAKFPAVVFNMFHSQLAEPSAAMKWADVEFFDAITDSIVIEQAEPNGLVVIEDYKWKSSIFLPVEVENGVVVQVVGAFFAVVERKLLGILPEQFP